MKNLLTITFVLAYASVSAMACEFHGGGDMYSLYGWPNNTFNHVPVSEPNNNFSSESAVERTRQTDFRFTRTRSPSSDDKKSTEEQDNSQ